MLLYGTREGNFSKKNRRKKSSTHGSTHISCNHISHLLSSDFVKGGSWTYIANMNTPRSKLCAAMLNGQLYAIGGWNGNDGYLKSVERYDPVADHWSLVAEMRETRKHAAALAHNGRIYVAGGWNDVNGYVRSIECYDP